MAAICESCKHHIYIARDGSAICRQVEREKLSAYRWACIWCGEYECPYYEARKGKKEHLSEQGGEAFKATNPYKRR